MSAPRLLPLPTILPLAESDIDAVIIEAGGRRLSDEAHLMRERSADYQLANDAIELKILEEEGFDKSERQQKLANLFKKYQNNRPVVIIDTRLLPKDAMQDYIPIMDGPIRSAVSKARTQIKQTKKSNENIASGTLFVVNNNFSAVTHDDLLDYVVRRVKNDTKEIDNVIVAGCYLHSDGFDTYSFWPIDYININAGKSLSNFEKIRSSWSALANRHMSAFVRGEHGLVASKKSSADLSFDLHGITFVKPATAIGNVSSFYGQRRPRVNEITFDQVPQVAQTLPNFTVSEFRKFRRILPLEYHLRSYEAWLNYIDTALRTGTIMKPVVPLIIDQVRWYAWHRKNPGEVGLMSLAKYANERFNRRISQIVAGARNSENQRGFPRRYIAINTEIIGQDEKNDISNIAIARRLKSGDYSFKPLVIDARIGRKHALCLAAAYAVKNDVHSMFLHQDTEFGWI